MIFRACGNPVTLTYPTSYDKYVLKRVSFGSKDCTKKLKLECAYFLFTSCGNIEKLTLQHQRTRVRLWKQHNQLAAKSQNTLTLKTDIPSTVSWNQVSSLLHQIYLVKDVLTLFIQMDFVKHVNDT